MTDSDPLTAESLLAGFAEAGYNTKGKLIKLLVMAKAQTTRAAKVIALDALAAKRTAANASINAEQEALQGEINDLSDQIIAAAKDAATSSGS